MAVALSRSGIRLLVAAAIALTLGLAGYLAYQRYTERYVVTQEEDGTAVTRLIAARLSGASSLKVAELSGTIQSSASDVRGFGWLRSDQVVKMPFAVDYFVDVSRIGADDIEWIPLSRTLVVNAPDVTVANPNVDEGRRTLVRTQGMFVTREAAEELSRRTSQGAATKARAEASSPERLAQAREKARAALATLMATPLDTLGHEGARVLVTFPAERSANGGERWDVTAPVDEVLANRR